MQLRTFPADYQRELSYEKVMTEIELYHLVLAGASLLERQSYVDDNHIHAS